MSTSYSYTTNIRLNRYALTRIIDDEYYETSNIVDIPLSTDDVYHTFSNSDYLRLDWVSNNYYSTPKYWWIIAMANNIIDPFADVYDGLIVRIPSINTIKNIFGGLYGKAIINKSRYSSFT